MRLGTEIRKMMRNPRSPDSRKAASRITQNAFNAEVNSFTIGSCVSPSS